MKKKEQDLVEKIRELTGGEFITEGYFTTLEGWIKQYDSQGRLLTPDPNRKEGTIIVDGIEYKLIRAGWKAWIYTMDRRLISTVDLTPDYIKEKEKES